MRISRHRIRGAEGNVKSQDPELGKVRVSVVVPAYNEAENIPVLMEEFSKMFSQSKMNGEVILVDRLQCITRLGGHQPAAQVVAGSDLAPRIKELRVTQEQLNKARVQVEAELIIQDKPCDDTDLVKSYAEDLKSLLEESDCIESKASLRSFIKKIVVNREKATIHYSLPVPPD